MKKEVISLFFILFVAYESGAQEKANDIRKSYDQAASFGVAVPIGVFSESHIAGLSGSYSWSNNRFGHLSTLPKKPVGLAADGGVDYYFGKRVPVAGYDFRYGGYFYFHIFGGIIYNPCKRGNVALTGGPTLGLYKGSADAGYGIRLYGSYYLTDRVALSPGIMYMKHALVNTLWSAVLMTTYNF